MSKNRLLVWFLAGWILGGAPACRMNKEITSPRDFLPSGPAGVARETYGGWMVATLKSSEDAGTVQGELIAVHNDSVYVLSPSQVDAFPLSDLDSAKLELHRHRVTGYVLASVLGGISTLSHGGFLLFTAPMWLITGISVSSSVSKQPNVIYFPQTAIDEFRKFSRFPQGLPTGIAPEQLVAKPLTR